MRKRFCRSFDFELQASADDNGIVLSLGAQHSFPLEQMFKLVPSHLARDVLVQAFLAVPMFKNRWRWNVTRALQMKRSQKGQRVPPHLQRMRSDDLLSAVFPAQTACQENVVGDIDIPDQPLVRQTVHDCLHEAADIDGLLAVLRDIESGRIAVIGLDSREPSPFAHELLNAHPYAFLDDAPLEERRARAVTLRRSLSIESLRDLGRLDPDAIVQVRAEAWPLVRDADELHDVLLSAGAVFERESQAWRPFFDELRATGRAACVTSAERFEREPNCEPLWVATERWPLIQAVWPDAQVNPAIVVPQGVRCAWPRDEAVTYLVRGQIECRGPTTVTALGAKPRAQPLRCGRCPCRAGEPGNGPARSVHRHGRARMVRPPFAGADPSLHARRPAPANRTGPAGTIRPLPAPPPARPPRDQVPRATGVARSDRATRRVRSPCRSLGEVPLPRASRIV